MKYSIDELERHSLRWMQLNDRIGDLYDLIAEAETYGYNQRAKMLEKQLEKAKSELANLKE